MAMKMMDCDLVVLGAGGAGLVAGVKAADLTGKKVIILEKSRKPGGCTYFASGMGEAGPVRDSKMQKDGGYEVSEAQDISGQWFDWFVSKGGSESYFSIVSQEQTNGISGFHYPNGMMGGGGIAYPFRTEKYKDLPDPTIGPGRLGSWVVDRLVDCCRKQGIDLLTGTRARRLLTDDKGHLSGVIADTGDGQLLINCKACVVAAGGYGRNMDLLKKYYPKQFDGRNTHSLCPPAMTGDGILAAEEIGAFIDPTIRDLDFPGGFFADGLSRHCWSPSLELLTGNGKAVIVNLDGKRWKNEAGRGGEEISAQRGAVACAIVDSDMVEEAASQTGGTGNRKRYPPVLKKDLEWEAAMDEAGAKGDHTKKADTLVELALKMKIDPRAFVDTIERYNNFCETGKDPDFGKSAEMLQPIKTPPFYAIYGHRWSQSTKGRNGIAVNSKFQALDTRGEVIPGLYAAGDGCTIFGGLTLNSPNMGYTPPSEEAMAARAALSKDVAQAFAADSSVGSPGVGGSLGRDGLPMGGDAQTDILKSESAACGGLGPAFLSGYCAGTFAAKYIKDF